MGFQVIKQPDGLLCVWSTEHDEIVVADATREFIVKWFMIKAEEQARRQATWIVQEVLADRADNVYPRNRAMTYEQAAAEHERTGGDPALLCPAVRS